MPAGPRPRRQPTDDRDQLRLLVTSPEQATYELLRPVVLFGQSARSRARETGVPERSLRRQVARFAAAGMRSLFEQEPESARDRRRLPAAIRRAIVELKAEYPPFGLREIAAICRERFDRPVDHHTVKQVLATEPLPIRLPRRFRRHHEIAAPVQRRTAIVELYLEGWSARSIAGYLATSRARVYDTLRRWVAEGLPGLADRSRAPRRPARKVDLRAMAAVRRLQANPELGEFRIHAALAQQGIDLSPRTYGRILALHRALGAPKPAAAVLPARLDRAAQQELGYADFFAGLLEEERAARTAAETQRRLRQAGFPFAATIEQFNFRFRPELKRQVVLRYLDPIFVEQAGTTSAWPPPSSTG